MVSAGEWSEVQGGAETNPDGVVSTRGGCKMCFLTVG